MVDLYELMIVGTLLFHIEQIAILISIYHDGAGWKFRSSRVKGHSQLRPVAATWKIALVIFAISLFIIPIIGALLYDQLVSFVNSIKYNFLIIISGLIGAFFFIWHYFVEKDWNRAQILLLIISFGILGIMIYLNLFITQQ